MVMSTHAILAKREFVILEGEIQEQLDVEAVVGLV